MRARSRIAAAFLVAGFVALPIATPVRAELYRWVDASGELHVTDDPSEVPPEHRDAARWEEPAAADPGSRWNTLETPSSVHRSVPASAARLDSRGPGKGRTHVIPVRPGAREIRLQAVLDERVTAPCIADTGATLNTMPRRIIEELGIEIDASTPRVFVTGISGRPVQAPLVRLRSVRVGQARVENLEVAVLDSLPMGLLGMPFFNHFRTSLDPAQGTLTLQEIDFGGIEGIYGGYDESTWRAKFRQVKAQIEGIRRTLDSLPEEMVGTRAELDAQHAQWVLRLEELELEASRAGVPVGWRE